MLTGNFSLNDLRDSLNALPPVDLLGVRLFQTHTTVCLFPTQIARDQLVAAVAELVAYGERCRATLAHLNQLASIPLTNIPALEFGL
jgi:hypothetical protein